MTAPNLVCDQLLSSLDLSTPPQQTHTIKYCRLQLYF